MNATPSPSKYATTDRIIVFAAALILAVIVTGPGAESGQSFDCRSAHAADEVTICHEPHLAKLDQDLAALRRQRNEAKRDDVEGNEIAFLNARRRCGENRGCIEQSYRNRIQELARPFSEQGNERLGRPDEKQADRQLNGRDSHRQSPRRTINPVSTSRSTNPRSVHEPSLTLIRHELRDQVNSGLVTIILGGLDSGDLSDATDLVTTIKGPQLRILPVAGGER